MNTCRPPLEGNRYQTNLGGDGLIGRRLYRLFSHAGFSRIELSVQPEIHWHGSRGFPDWIRTIIGNIEGARLGLITSGLCDEPQLVRAIAELEALLHNRDSSSHFMWNRALAIREAGDLKTLPLNGRIKAILWDNDGVLVDTEHLYFQANQHVLASVGIELTEEEYIELFLVQGRGAWHLAEENGIASSEIDRLRSERNALYGDLLVQAPRLNADITRVLDALHGKYVMGVVTSSRKDHFDLIHRATGLLKYFDFVLTASDYSHGKPDPEPYLRAVVRSGVGREACVAIEDSERGLASATGAGVSCIVVPSGLTRGGNFETAQRVFGSLGEILTVL